MDKNVIQLQPGQYQTMANPGPMPGVPQGLEYLTQVDQLIAKQQVELMEVLTGFECKNKFRIFNSLNQQVFFAFEESSLCMRLCCGPGRGFIMHITDNYQQEVLSIERPFICCTGCCWCADGCCKYPVFVKDKMGNQLGMIRMMNSCCKPHFGVFDNDEVLLYETCGPCCPCQCVCGCTNDVKFPMFSVRDQTVIGDVSKIWGGALLEICFALDTFSVTFPMNLDVKHKALLIGAIFTIDLMVFEKQKRNRE